LGANLGPQIEEPPGSDRKRKRSLTIGILLIAMKNRDIMLTRPAWFSNASAFHEAGQSPLAGGRKPWMKTYCR
jgi:hypothetical protein